MENWEFEFLGAANKKIINVNRNGDYGLPKALQLDPDWSFMEFLNAASNRLNLIPSARRAFNASGVEIDDCMMILDDDRMFLSEGEAFSHPKPKRESKDKYSSFCDQINETSTSDVGPYTVGELLGRGGFGEVRVGLNHLTGEKVALKFLRKADILSVGAAERTSTEIQCLTTLSHPNIIRLFVRLETHKYVVLAFDLMAGGDMLKYLQKRGPLASECALSEPQAKSIFLQVLAGLEFSHRNLIIHRDLKLENLLLKDDTLDCVKIADFGLSQFYRPGVLMNCDGSGTLSISAPELLVKPTFNTEQNSYATHNYGPPLDVWSLGVVLFALLNGRLPFQGATLGGDQPSDSALKSHILKCKFAIDTRVSVDGKDLIRRMLEKNPADRPTIIQIYEHRWVRTLGSHEINVLIVKSKSGDEIIYKNFQEYCGRSMSPDGDEKPDLALNPILKKRPKSIMADGIPGIPGAQTHNQSCSSLLFFNRGPDKRELRRLPSKKSLDCNAIDRESQFGAPKRGRSTLNLVREKLDRSASVSPRKLYPHPRASHDFSISPSTIESILLRMSDIGLPESESSSSTFISIPEMNSLLNNEKHDKFDKHDKIEKHGRHILTPSPARNISLTLLNSLPPESLRGLDTHPPDKIIAESPTNRRCINDGIVIEKICSPSMSPTSMIPIIPQTPRGVTVSPSKNTLVPLKT